MASYETSHSDQYWLIGCWCLIKSAKTKHIQVKMHRIAIFKKCQVIVDWALTDNSAKCSKKKMDVAHFPFKMRINPIKWNSFDLMFRTFSNIVNIRFCMGFGLWNRASCISYRSILFEMQPKFKLKHLKRFTLWTVANHFGCRHKILINDTEDIS